MELRHGLLCPPAAASDAAAVAVVDPDVGGTLVGEVMATASRNVPYRRSNGIAGHATAALPPGAAIIGSGMHRYAGTDSAGKLAADRRHLIAPHGRYAGKWVTAAGRLALSKRRRANEQHGKRDWGCK
ncbi:MAG: hypothetical protein ACTSW2_03465 [Alphaproteobacteria bacterium]